MSDPFRDLTPMENLDGIDHSANGHLSEDALLDRRLRTDGMLWREQLPGIERLAQQVATLAREAPPATSRPLRTKELPMLEEVEKVRVISTTQPLSPRGMRRQRRWFSFSGLVAAALIIAMFSTFFVTRSLQQHPGIQPTAQASAVSTVAPTATPAPSPTHAPTATPTPRPGYSPVPPCSSAAPKAGAIRAGGLGASISTFPAAWGTQIGGSSNGTYQFGDVEIMTAHTNSQGKVVSMTWYSSDNVGRPVGDAFYLITSHMPQDAAKVGGSSSNWVLTEKYCSTSLAAAFPANPGPPQTGFYSISFFETLVGFPQQTYVYKAVITPLSH